MRIFIIIPLSFLAGCCGVGPQEVSCDDPVVQKLLRATGAASAYRFGFTPVSSNADIRLGNGCGRCDRMLRVDGRTSRTINFRKQGDGFKWIGEQETYKGPKQYTTVDGTSFEEVCLTYELQRVVHYKLNRLNIEYFGEDERLAHKDNLTLQTILPILKEWGYDVKQIGAANGNKPIRSEKHRTSSAAGSRR